MKNTIGKTLRRTAGVFCIAPLLFVAAHGSHTPETRGAGYDFTERQRALLHELRDAFPDAGSLNALQTLIGEDIKRRAIAELRAAADGLPEFGEQDGPLVVEFSDYQCGYCKRMFPLLRAENVRVKMVEFPVLGALSTRAARLALAAQKQNRYADFHIALMSDAGRLSEEKIRAAADTAGLDWERLLQDGESEEISAALRENRRLATMMGVRGTPFMVIGERTVPGAVSGERLKQLLAEAAP